MQGIENENRDRSQFTEENLIENCNDVKFLREKVLMLFQVIDDIDTGLDMFKQNHEGYQKFCAKHVGRRWDGLTSNGRGVYVDAPDSQESKSRYQAVKDAFPEGVWVFGLGEEKGCSYTFDYDTDNPQPFSYLGTCNPDDFRIATPEEIIEGMRNIGIHQFISVKDCMRALKVHMRNDEPEKPGSYAHGWHCNIATACFDSIPEDAGIDRHKIGNEAASRFMKICFDVETKG